jgi:polar amino acid transport system substrate-binding protein
MDAFSSIWRRFVVGVVLTFASVCLYAQESERVLRAAFLHFPPMAYVDDNGEPAGKVIELTNRVAAESGLKITWVSYPIRRIYKGLEDGDIDIWPGSQSVPALRDFTLETPSIGIDINLCALSLQATPAVTDPQALSSSQLVLIRGYTYRTQLDSIFANAARRPIVAPDHTAAIALLEKGRGDYLISYDHPIELALQQQPQINAKCDMLDSWPLVYVVSSRLPDAPEVVATLTNSYRRLTEADSKSASFAQAR